MTPILAALAKAVAQLPDPSFRRVLWRGLGIAAVLYAALLYAAHWMLAAFWPDSWLVSVFGTLAAFVVLSIVFPAFATACIALFADDIAEAVERRHYPHLPPGRVPPIGVVAIEAAKFLALSLTLNLLALPLYLLGLVFPPFNLFVFCLLNGYLLGREYFDLVAQRHHAPADARRLRRAMRWQRLLAGMAIALLFSVPLINLAMSLVATAAMVHLVLGPRGTGAGGANS